MIESRREAEERIHFTQDPLLVTVGFNMQEQGVVLKITNIGYLPKAASIIQPMISLTVTTMSSQACHTVTTTQSAGSWWKSLELLGCCKRQQFSWQAWTSGDWIEPFWRGYHHWVKKLQDQHYSSTSLQAFLLIQTVRSLAINDPLQTSCALCVTDVTEVMIDYRG